MCTIVEMVLEGLGKEEKGYLVRGLDSGVQKIFPRNTQNYSSN